MIRNRKLSKKLAAAVLAAAMMVGTSMTAFAYVDPGAAETAAEAVTESSTSDTGQEQNAEEEAVLKESSDTAFSTPGNAQLEDDITEDSTKEFLTITTKNNNTFYLVIDRSANTENVYMLSQIDEDRRIQTITKYGRIIWHPASGRSRCRCLLLSKNPKKERTGRKR